MPMPIPSQSSGRKTSDTQISTDTCYLTGVIVECDGTNAATVEIYDGTSSSGTLVFRHIYLGANTKTDPVFINVPIICNGGMFLDLTGTGAAATVLYVKA